MGKKIIFFILIIGFVFILSACKKKEENKNSLVNDIVDVTTGIGAVKIKEKADEKLAIAKAIELWRVKLLSGEDLSDGPCLSNKIIPDWVADIAHDPRQEIDDLPQNQCSAYREGTAHHFVELDPEGNVIRTY